jgi:hypothetical protein
VEISEMKMETLLLSKLLKYFESSKSSIYRIGII